ncbi:MAG TPA: PA2169 family four-helix-bundle protein [Bryobacteraceae bacterium]|jgi:uncharacterized protein (TIGR02284 family)|nr:PA2169 family four-helix-bundle protein [Bryobacteraceae bacterium]
MATDLSEVRSTLNDLIETCKDAQQGFRDAAEKIQDGQIRTLFLKYSVQRSEFAGELQAEVTRIGGEPAKSGSTGGAIHRGWIGLKAALTGDNSYAILAEAERGEDAAVKNYREALGKDLPSDIHDILKSQLREVHQTHDIVRQLRDAARPVTSTGGTGSPA